MSGRAAAITLRVAAALFGAMWIVAAISTLLAPATAYEFTVRLVGTSVAATPALTVWVALEAGLGAGMLLGALRGYVPTAAMLVAASTALLIVKSRYNGQVRCGCMGLMADESVDQSLVRNAVLIAVVVALALLARFSYRTHPPGPAAEASGRATPSP